MAIAILIYICFIPITFFTFRAAEKDADVWTNDYLLLASFLSLFPFVNIIVFIIVAVIFITESDSIQTWFDTKL